MIMDITAQFSVLSLSLLIFAVAGIVVAFQAGWEAAMRDKAEEVAIVTSKRSTLTTAPAHTRKDRANLK